MNRLKWRFHLHEKICITSTRGEKTHFASHVFVYIRHNFLPVFCCLAISILKTKFVTSCPQWIIQRQLEMESDTKKYVKKTCIIYFVRTLTHVKSNHMYDCSIDNSIEMIALQLIF